MRYYRQVIEWLREKMRTIFPMDEDDKRKAQARERELAEMERRIAALINQIAEQPTRRRRPSKPQRDPRPFEDPRTLRSLPARGTARSFRRFPQE